MPADVPRLFLITPPIAHPAEFAPLLEAALDSGDVASVLLRTAARDESGAKAVVRELAPLVQARDAALLIEGDPRVVARVGADGLHVSGVGAGLLAALDALRPRAIVGCGGLHGRDDAMAAGEAGADYLLFGGPDAGQSPNEVAERIAWWSEIFNVPCVGYADHPSRAIGIAEAGAEFIALCDGLWTSPAEIAAVLRELTRSLVGAVGLDA